MARSLRNRQGVELAEAELMRADAMLVVNAREVAG